MIAGTAVVALLVWYGLVAYEGDGRAAFLGFLLWLGGLLALVLS